MAELVQYYGTGRRKSAVARVYLRPGTGDFKINGKAFEQYFVTARSARARGSHWFPPRRRPASTSSPGFGRGREWAGRRGEAGHRARTDEFNLEFRKKLKAEGMVSRDARSKERKKYGQKGARKRFQYSKR